MSKKLYEQIETTCQPTSRYLKYKSNENSKGKDHGKNLKMTTCPFCGSTYSASQQRVRLRSKVKLNNKLARLLQIHDTSPECLGKYQLNMVKNYLNSSNQLMVTCSICNKTAKYPCLKRSDILQQKVGKQKIQSAEMEQEPTKKKKKKKRKKGKLMDVPLELSIQSEQTLQNSERQRTPLQSPKTVLKEVEKEITKIDKPEPSVTPSDVTRNLHSMVKRPISQTHKTPDHTISSKSAKKKKAKNIHQQLNKMLAKEKNEKKPGNLMDFLSNL